MARKAMHWVSATELENLCVHEVGFLFEEWLKFIYQRAYFEKSATVCTDFIHGHARNIPYLHCLLPEVKRFRCHEVRKWKGQQPPGIELRTPLLCHWDMATRQPPASTILYMHTAQAVQFHTWQPLSMWRQNSVRDWFLACTVYEDARASSMCSFRIWS